MVYSILPCCTRQFEINERKEQKYRRYRIQKIINKDIENNRYNSSKDLFSISSFAIRTIEISHIAEGSLFYFRLRRDEDGMTKSDSQTLSSPPFFIIVCRVF